MWWAAPHLCVLPLCYVLRWQKRIIRSSPRGLLPGVQKSILLTRTLGHHLARDNLTYWIGTSVVLESDLGLCTSCEIGDLDVKQPFGNAFCWPWKWVRSAIRRHWTTLSESKRYLSIAIHANFIRQNLSVLGVYRIYAGLECQSGYK